MRASGGDSVENVDDPVAIDDDGGRATDSDARRTDRRYALRLTVLGVFGGMGAALVYTAAAVIG